MLTTDSNVFRCSWDIANAIARSAGLHLVIAPYTAQIDKYIERSEYWAWEDAQTSGEGARITFFRDIAWVSRHSGRAEADMTEEVCYFFGLMGARPVDSIWWMANPRIYGLQDAYKWGERFTEEGK